MKPNRSGADGDGRLAVWGSSIPAYAVPPTATPSPGYDARLQEQRAAQRMQAAPVLNLP